MSSATSDDFHTAATDLRLATFRLARRLRSERALDSMSDAQFAVLGTLRMHGRATLGALAEREQVTAPSMSRTVSCLEEQGFVARVPDADDRRRVYIDITPEGRAVVADTISRRDSALAEALAELGFTAAELDTIRKASDLMRKVAER
ncbi:MAG: MarR family transcriptional regulator [Microbacterium sp.]